jgi:hypothetical protein
MARFLWQRMMNQQIDRGGRVIKGSHKFVDNATAIAVSS